MSRAVWAARIPIGWLSSGRQPPRDHTGASMGSVEDIIGFILDLIIDNEPMPITL